jgi:hypothetical protein
LAPAAGKVYLETKKERRKKICTFKTFPKTHHCTTKRSPAPKNTRDPKQQSPSRLLESPELGTRISCLKENGKTLPLRIRPNSTPLKKDFKKKAGEEEKEEGGKNPKLQSKSIRRRKRETHLNPNCKAKQKKEGRSLDPKLQSRAGGGGGGGGGNQTCNCNQETATKSLDVKL